MSQNFFYDLLRSWMLPLKEIDEIIPQKGLIYDLGCGEGVTAKLLAKVKTRKIIGVDNNKNRLQKSDLANLNFKYRDLKHYSPEDANAIIISDVLHHLNFRDQKKLLGRIAKNLKKDGILLIKEIDTMEFVRSILSRFWDFIFYPKDKIYYWNSKNLKNYLEKLNFNVIMSRPTRFFPGSTTLFVCTKK